MNNVFILSTGTLYKNRIMKTTYTLLIISFLILIGGCKNSGFYGPYTMDLRVPDGPPEFQAGWHDGCASGLNNSSFQNARFHEMSLGSGIYQHDPIYQMAYAKALFSCAIMAGDFLGHPMFTGPLEH